MKSPPKKRRLKKAIQSRKPTKATKTTKAAKPKRATKTKKRAAKKKAPAKKKVTKKKKVTTKRRSVLKELPKHHVIRQQALTDFVTDPEGRDERHHYLREDRQYAKFVTLEGFRRWKEEDRWALQREGYWAEAQRLLLEKTRDQTIQMLSDSVHHMTELRTYALEWCEPLRDPMTGEILRYPEKNSAGKPHRYAGKPMLPVRPGNYEKAVAAALALDDAVQERRNEVLRLTGNGSSATKVGEVDPNLPVPDLSQEHIRELAMTLVKKRQPELVTEALDLSAEEDEEEHA